MRGAVFFVALLAGIPSTGGISTEDMQKCHAETGFTMPVTDILNCDTDMRRYVECLDTTHCKQRTDEYIATLKEFRRVCCTGSNAACDTKRYDDLCGSSNFGEDETNRWLMIGLYVTLGLLGATVLCYCCFCMSKGTTRRIVQGLHEACADWSAVCSSCQMCLWSEPVLPEEYDALQGPPAAIDRGLGFVPTMPAVQAPQSTSWIPAGTAPQAFVAQPAMAMQQYTSVQPVPTFANPQCPYMRPPPVLGM